MATTANPWELRFDWTLSVLHWGGLALALFISGLDDGPNPEFAAAGLIAGAYVVTMQAMPRRVRQSPVVGEAIAVMGVVASLVAVSLTGGARSPYLLFLSAPTFFASAFLSLRHGLEIALLSSAGLAVVAASLDQDLIQGPVLQAGALYLLIAVTAAQARRIMLEESERSAAFREATALDAGKVERLTAAHSLLTSLSELANSAELNPVSVGDAALRDLTLLVPFSSGQVALVDEAGSIVVAHRGEAGPDSERIVYSMAVGDRTVGELALWPLDERPLEPYREVVEHALGPVALALDNIMLLQTIAHRAVREERTRLARELHDEIGPSLASLGLGIDLAIHQYQPAPEMARHLKMMRRNVTRLVEEVRTTVADMRLEASDSVIEQIHQLVADVGADGPAILVDIDERRPPRTAIAGELNAILTELVRNAVEHAGSKSVRIEGQVDRDSGSLSVEDDGRGFDASVQPKDHYGLIGVKERAEEIGADVDVKTSPGAGTKVTVSWGT